MLGGGGGDQLKKTPISQGKEHVNLVGILLVTYRDLSHFLFLSVHIPS